MEDSRETHINNVNDLCRICARVRVTRKQQKHNSRSHLCSALSGDIFLIYDLYIKKILFLTFICDWFTAFKRCVWLQGYPDHLWHLPDL